MMGDEKDQKDLILVPWYPNFRRIGSLK